MKRNKSLSMAIEGTCIFLAAILFIFTPSSSNAASSEQIKIKLKYGSYGPRSTIDDPIFWYIDQVSKKTGVKIELETYFSGTLAKPQDCLGALANGVYDIGWISPAFTPGRTPLAMIPGSTPIVAQSLYSTLKAADEVFQVFSPAADEFKKANVKYLFHTGVWQYELISTKPVKSLEDIKGLRVRTFGYQSKAWAELGGVPVSIPITEAYDALQKGVIDGVLTQPIPMYKSLHLSEVAKNYTKVDFGCLPAPLVMNMGAWKKLPEKVRKEMVELAGEMPAKADQIVVSQELKAIEDMRKDGVRIYDLPDSDKARVMEVGESIAKIFVEDLTSKGITNAGKVMEIYLNALKKYAK